MQHPHRHPKNIKKTSMKRSTSNLNDTPSTSTMSCHVDTLPPHDAKSNAANPSRRHLDLLPVSGFCTVDVDNYGQGWSNPCINFKRWYVISQDSKRTGLLQRGPRRNNGKAYLEDSQVYSFGFLFIQFLSARILASLRGKLLQRLPLA